MGNPRKPTALRVIQGNPGRRPIPKNEPRPRPGIPYQPKHLDAYAREEWDRMAAELLGIGLVTPIDGVPFAAYCVCVSRWRQSEESLARMKARDPVTNGLLIKTTNGNVIQNPLIGIANRSMLMAIRIAGEFGMSPAARARFGELKRNDPDQSSQGKESYF